MRSISARTRIVQGDPRHLRRYRFALKRAFAPGETDYPRQRISRQWREHRWCARIPGCLAFLYVLPVPLRAVASIVQRGSIRTLCNARRFTIDVLHAPWPTTCILNDDPSFPSLLQSLLSLARIDMSSIYTSRLTHHRAVGASGGTAILNRLVCEVTGSCRLLFTRSVREHCTEHSCRRNRVCWIRVAEEKVYCSRVGYKCEIKNVRKINHWMAKRHLKAI